MKKAARIALDLRDKYTTNNPFELCDYLDICVLFFDLPISVRGFYTIICDKKVIYLNTSLDENERLEICAHELGHALLHENENSIFLSEKTYNICNKFELEADIFCAYFLLDEIYSPDEITTIEKISCETGLSSRVVRLRYEN